MIIFWLCARAFVYVCIMIWIQSIATNHFSLRQRFFSHHHNECYHGHKTFFCTGHIYRTATVVYLKTSISAEKRKKMVTDMTMKPYQNDIKAIHIYIYIVHHQHFFATFVVFNHTEAGVFVALIGVHNAYYIHSFDCLFNFTEF